MYTKKGDLHLAAQWPVARLRGLQGMENMNFSQIIQLYKWMKVFVEFWPVHLI